MQKSEQINELAAALAKAQGEIRDASKDSVNPHFRSSYADLASVWAACRMPLSKHGLSIVQSLSTTDQGSVSVTTMLLHQSGQYLSDTLVLTPRDASPQSFGSASTFGKRYGLMAMVGVAPGDDDDGNAASIPAVNTERPKVAPRASNDQTKAAIGKREELNKLLMDLYKPFMANAPEGFVFKTMLAERYGGIEETKHLSLEQLEDLSNHMREGIKAGG